jgi:hypothetical protein
VNRLTLVSEILLGSVPTTDAVRNISYLPAHLRRLFRLRSRFYNAQGVSRPSAGLGRAGKMLFACVTAVTISLGLDGSQGK